MMIEKRRAWGGQTTGFGLAAALALWPAAAPAAGTKTGGAETVVDDLQNGEAGAAQDSSASPAKTLDGGVGQIGTFIGSGGVETLEAGYFSMLVGTPTTASFQAAYASSVAVQWTDATPANPAGTSYLVELSTASDFTGTILSSSVVALSATVPGLVGNTTYYGRVSAHYDGMDDSAYILLGGTRTFILLPAGCGNGFNVRQDGTQNYTTISAAVNALLQITPSLSTTTCVVIRDTNTYTEQVTVQGFTNNGFQFKIMADPAFSSTATVVSPPASSIAAFQILNASVTIQNLMVQATVGVPYGIKASSAYVTISSVNVSGAANIATAGLFASSFSVVAYSSVAVGGAGVAALWLDGLASGVSYSTFTNANLGSGYGVYVHGSSSNTLANVSVPNSFYGFWLDSNSNSNLISRSSVTGGGYTGIYMTNSSTNTIANTYISAGSYGIWFNYNSSSNTVSGSTMAVASFGGYALLVQGAASNTVAQGFISNSVGDGAYILSAGGANAANNLITQSTITSSGAGKNALNIAASVGLVTSSNTILQSYVGNPNGYGASLGAGASYNTISQSTITSNSAAAGVAALYLTGVSSNAFTQDYISNPVSTAAYLTGASFNNTISLSTMSSNSTAAALDMNGASSNTITQSFMTNPGGYGAYLVNNSSYNTISFSTITSNAFGGGAPLGALYLSAVSSNTITQSYVSNLSGVGAYLNTSANYNTISLSTITNNAGNIPALQLAGSSSNNTITQSFVSGLLGDGADLQTSANYNTISFSTIKAYAAGGYSAVNINSASFNTIRQSVLSNPAGWGAYLLGNANSNTISQSTVTGSAAAGFAGVYLTGVSSNTVSGSYVQGSTAVYVYGSTGTMVNSSVLNVAAGGGSGLVLTGGSVNLSMSSNVVAGAYPNGGVYIDALNSGLIQLSTNTILPGAQFAVYVASQSAGTNVWITSNTILPTVTAANNTYGIYLTGLTSGATIQNNGIYYRTSGSMGGFTSYALYAAGSAGIEIDHNRISNPGMITAGSYVGVYLTGTTNTLFKFNDLYSMGTGLTSAWLLQALSGATGNWAKDNIFSSSVSVTGAVTSSGTVYVDATSQAGGGSDYNDFFSSNSSNFMLWGTAGCQFVQGLGWTGAGCPVNNDLHSIAANPYWAGTASGSEDFHPLTQATNGRYRPVTGAFDQTDTVSSLTIDHADPAEAVSSSIRLPPTNAGLEPAPNAGLANQGSYGQTDQASESFIPPPPVLAGPGNGAFVSTATPSFVWSGTAPFRIQVANLASFVPAVVVVDSITTGSNNFFISTTPLSNAVAYFWRVAGSGGTVPLNAATTWSSVFNFTVDVGTPAYSGPQASTNPATGPWTALPMTSYLSSTAAGVQLTAQESVSGLLVSTGSPAGLVGQWHFDESSGTAALDASTNSMTANFTGAPLPSRAAGYRGGALSIPSGGYVDSPANGSQNADDLTIELWIKPTMPTLSMTGADPCNALVSKRVANATHQPYSFLIKTGGGLSLNWYAGAPTNGWLEPTAPAVIQLNQWQHVAVTRATVGGNATVVFYYNGAPFYTSVQAGVGPVAYDSEDLLFGWDDRCKLFTTSGYFQGLMDEVRLFGVARSSAQILADYESDTLAAHNNSAAYNVLYSTNAGLTWNYLSTASVTMPGTNGTTAAQTMTASGIPVVTSTGAGAPTNEVEFVLSDMAGGVSTATYVLLVDTVTPAAASSPNYPANASFVGTGTFTFDWTGPSTGIVQGLGAGASFYLQVSNNDSAFAPVNIVVSISTPAVVKTTTVPTADGAYASTYTLAAGTYYWRVAAISGISGAQSPWSAANQFKIDLASPTAASFASLASTGGATGLLGEAQINNLATGVTAQITVQDALSGLAVSTFALAFAGDGHNNPGATSGFGVIYSTNAGQTWIDASTVNASAVGGAIFALAGFNGKLYAGDNNGKVYSSADGVTWNNPATAGGNQIRALGVFNGKLYAENNGVGKIVSSADGTTWSAGVPVGVSIWALTVFNGKLYAGDGGNGKVYSSADGATWNAGTAVGAAIESFAVFNGKLYAGDNTNGKVYSSADGVAWSAGTLVGANLSALAAFNGQIYAADYANGKVYSSADGATWSAGTTVGSRINALAVFNGKLYAGDVSNSNVYSSADGATWNVVTNAAGAAIYGLAAFNGKLYAGDFTNGKVYQITPVAAALTGADGSLLPQTLTATGLNLVQSTSNATCGGASPCGATNQVKFTASDLAGNVKAAGPYAILVDTVTPIAVSTPSFPGNLSFISTPTAGAPGAFAFDWLGPSTMVAAGLGAPLAGSGGLGSGASYYLQVSNNDPAFAPANILISVSTPVVIQSTSLATVGGAYSSTFTLANNASYFWRVLIRNNVLGTTSPWSAAYQFTVDNASPTAASFASLASTGGVTGLLGEAQFNTLATGVTAQITVQDVLSGLAVSTYALAFAGDGHDNPGTTSGWGVLYSTNAGQTWNDPFTVSASALPLGVKTLAVFNGKLYAWTGGKFYSSADGVTWIAGAIVGSGIGALYVFNGRLYAGDGNNGNVYSSADGVTWSAGTAVGANIKALTGFNGKLYAGDGNGKLFASADGVSWSAGTAVAASISSALASFNGKLYAGDNLNGKVYSSADGVTWSAGTAVGGSIETMAVFNGRLYAGDGNGNIFSSADGATWSSAFFAGISNNNWALSVFNGKLYAGNWNGNVYSSPDGVVWSATVLAPSGQILSLAAFNGRLYAADWTVSTVYRLTPMAATLTGADGTTAAQTLTATGLNLVQSTNSTTCGGASPCGATNQVKFTASDLAGNVKTAGPYAILVDTVTPIAISTPSFPGNLSFVSTPTAGAPGAFAFNWLGPSTMVAAGLGAPVAVSGLGSGASYYLQVSNNDPAFAPANILISVSTPVVIQSTSLATVGGAYSSTFTLANNAAYFWRVMIRNNVLGTTSPWSAAYQFTVDNASPTAASFASLTSTGGATGLLGEAQFNTLASGVTAQITVQDALSGLAVSTYALAFAGDGHDNPGATSGFGVMYSTNAGQNWVDWSTYTATLSGTGELYIFSFAPFKGKLYAATGDSINNAKVYSTSDGTTWTPVLTGTGETYILTLFVFNGKLYAGTANNAKVYSTSDGATWTPVLTGTGETSIYSLTAFNGKLYAGTYPNAKVYATSDGTTWTQVLSGTGESFLLSLTAFNGKLYAGTGNNAKVYATSDGTTWTPVLTGTGETYLYSLAGFNGKLYAGTYPNAKVYATSDGTTWTPVLTGTGESYIYSLTAFNGKLYAGTGNNAKVYATSNGTTWTPVLTGTGEGFLYSLAGFNGKLYAGTNPNAKIFQITPAMATLTGADGTAAAQTLSATGLNLVQSTNTTICGGGGGTCGATNQVIFTASDLAGNVRTAGPYAILVDTAPIPPGCAAYVNVRKYGLNAYATIGAALGSLGTTLSGNTCVVIRDTQTYTEQVTVQNFTNNNNQLTFLSFPDAGLSGRPVVAPPVNSTAAFQILNASVTLQGITMRPGALVPYGVQASSAYVTISSVNVDSNGNIYTAGIALSSWSAVSASSVTIAGQNANALLIAGPGNSVAYSTMTKTSGNGHTVVVNGAPGPSAAGNSIYGSYVNNPGPGHAVALFANSNNTTISQSTITDNGAGVADIYISGSSSETITQCYLSNPQGWALYFSGAGTMTISQSTMTVNNAGYAGIFYNGGGPTYATLTQSLVSNPGGIAVNMQSSHYNTISQSTITSNAVGYAALYIAGASSNTISQSYISGGVSTAAYFAAMSNVNAITLSTITGNSTGAALYLNNSNSNSFSQSVVSNPGGYGAYLDAGASSNTISGSSLASNTNAAAALYLTYASSNTVTQSFVSNPAGHGAYLNTNANSNTINQSTITSNAGIFYALFLSSASSNVIAQDYISDPAGYGAVLLNYANSNTISQSTITSNSVSYLALYLNGVSSNTVTQSLLSNPVGYGAYLNNATSNTISLSTIASNAAFNYTALYLYGSSSNTFAQDYVSNPASTAAWLTAGSNFNAVSQSTMITSSPGIGLYVNNSQNNTVSRSVLTNSGSSYGLFIQNNGSTYNTVTQSAITGGAWMDGGTTLNTISQTNITNNSALNPALYLQSASSCTISQDFISNAAGTGVYLWIFAASNTIALSTITSGGADAIYLTGNSSTTIVNSYVQGKNGVNINGSTNTTVSGSVVVATNTFGRGVWLQGGASNLTAAADVVTGGPQGGGIYVDQYNSGIVALSTNTIQTGAEFGIFIATQSAGSQVWIASNTIIPAVSGTNPTYGILVNGLASGATIQNNGIYYRTPGGMGTQTACGICAVSAAGLAIDHNRISQPGMITGGSYVAMQFNATINSWFKFNDVASTGAGATQFYLMKAANGSTGIQVRDNIFLSSVSVAGAGSSSGTILVEGGSQPGFASDYNDWYGGNSTNTAYWGLTACNLGAGGWSGAGCPGQDLNSISVNPLWANVTPGSEDLHPMSGKGRYNAATGAMTLLDPLTSPTIDQGDPAESLTGSGSFGTEPAPNGGRANLGSYGQTAQASLSPLPPLLPVVTAVYASSITVSYGLVGANGYDAEASLAANFTLPITSVSFTGAASLSPQGLLPNTTYYLRAGALWTPTTFYAPILSTITLAAPPAAASPAFASVFVTSMTASWSVNGNPLGVTTFTVTATSGTSFPNGWPGNQTNTAVSTTAIAYSTFTGLAINTTYYVWAEAINNAGNATPWVLIGATSSLAVQPGPWPVVFATATANAAQVEWGTSGNPANPPLNVTTYTVVLSTISTTAAAVADVGSGFTVSLATSPPPPTSIAATFGPPVTAALTPNTTYFAYVNAVNGNGVGTPYFALGSTSTLANPPAAPGGGVFTGLTTPGWINGSLAANGNPAANPLSTTFTVLLTTGSSYPNGNSGNVNFNLVMQTSSSGFSQGALSINTTYYLFAQAVNWEGLTTPWIAFGATSTLANAPIAAAAPVTSTFTAVYIASASVVWSASGNPASAPLITTYTVVLSTLPNVAGAVAEGTSGFNQVLSTQPSAFGGSNLGATVTGLAANATYFLYIGAVNNAGAPTSFTSLGSTPTLPNLPATAVTTFTTVGNIGSTVAWSANGNAPGTQYQAVLSTAPTYGQTNPGNIIAVSTSPQGAPSAAFGPPATAALSPNTTYYLYVNAVSWAGAPTAYAALGSTVTLVNPPLVSTPAFSGVTASSLTALWGANGNGAGTQYNAYVSTETNFPNADAGTVFVATAPQGAPQAGFTGLLGDTSYYLFASALNRVGSPTAYSQLGSTLTSADAPATAVSTYTAVSSAALTAAWSANGNGAGTQYQAVVSTEPLLPHGDAGDVSVSTQPQGAPSAVLGPPAATALVPNTTYFLFVRTLSRAGATSLYLSLPSTSTLAADPVPAAAAFPALSSAALTAAWGANNNPPNQTRYNAVLSTAATYGQTNPGNTATVSTSPSGAPSASYAGLTANTTYYLYVSAVNNNGVPTVYDAVGATSTLAALPATAASTFTAVLATTMTVAWTSGGNPLNATTYTVLLSTISPAAAAAANNGNGFNVSFPTAPAGAALSATAAVLPNTTYYLYVDAVNNNGVGSAYSSLGSTITLANAPAQPTLVSTYTVVGSSFITVNWDPNGDPAATQFYVQASTDSGFGNGAVVLNSGWFAAGAVAASSAAFVNLSTNTLYFFEAAARNAALTQTTYTLLGSTATLAAAPASAAAPYVLVTATSVAAQWLANGNAAGTQFQLTASADPGFAAPVFQSGWVAALSTGVGGLSANTTYYLEVQARNLNNVGTPYLILPATTTPLLPLTTGGLANVGPYAARASWDPSGNRLGDALAGWQNQANALPAAVQGPAMVYYGGRLYASGGLNGGQQNAVWVSQVQADGSAGAWAATTPLPLPLESHAMAAWAGRLYVAGGSNGTPQSKVWWAPILGNGLLGAWSQATSLPTPLYKHAMSAANARLYVSGGDNGISAQPAVYSVDIRPDGTLGTWVAGPSLPAARSGHAMVFAGTGAAGALYVSGGATGAVDNGVLWSPVTNGLPGAWSATTPLPAVRARHAMAAGTGRLYVSGGNDGLSVQPTVWTAPVNPDNSVGAWSALAPLPSAVWLHAMALSGDRLYIAGGNDGTNPLATVIASSLTGTQFLLESAVNAGFTLGYASSTWRPASFLEASGLTPNTTYFFQVSARAAGGAAGAALALGSTITLAALPVAAAPAFTDVELGSVTFQWALGDNPAGTRFIAQASTASNFSGALFANAPSSAVFMTAVGLSVNTSYYVRVSAVNGGGTPSAYVALGATFTLAAAPTGSGVTLALPASFSLSWSANGNPPGTQYLAQVATGAAFTTILQSSATLGLSATFYSLPSAATFYGRVEALNGNGAASPFDLTVSTATQLDVTPPGVSTNAAAYQSQTANVITAQWTAAGNDGYAGNLIAGSAFYVQWSTYTCDPASPIWAPANAQVVLATGPVAPGTLVTTALTGIPSQAFACIREWTRDASNNYSAPSSTFGAFVSPFSFASIDGGAGLDVGRGASLAVDPAGNLHVAYRGGAGGASQLRYIKRTGGTWGAPQVVDASAQAAELSAAVDASGNPQILYRDVNAPALKLAAWTGSWTSSVVDAGNFIPGSLALDQDGRANVSYYDAAGTHLKFARWDGAAWNKVVVDAANGVGQFSSLALDALQNPHVSYFDATNGLLKYSSSTAGTWNAAQTVDGGGGVVVGSGTVIAVDGAGRAKIAYGDVTNQALKTAQFNGSGWLAQTVETFTAAGLGRVGGIAHDVGGRPQLVYSRRIAGANTLKFAQWTGASWSTMTVDSGGDQGDDSSIAIDGTGALQLAYYDALGRTLKNAQWSAGLGTPMGGNPRSRFQAPTNMAGTATSVTSIQWTWTNNATDDLGYRLYGSAYSTGPFVLIADSSTLGPVTSAGSVVVYNETGLTTGATYYRFAAAVSSGGVVAGRDASAYPFNNIDATPPTITNNQTGDAVWRKASGLYNVGFSDLDGGGLSKFQVEASTMPGAVGPFLSTFTDVVVNIGSVTFTTPWALPASVFNALLNGATNYITVRAVDPAGNVAVSTDAFYVRKDTAAPVIADNQTGDNTVRTAGGTTYNVTVLDAVSGLDHFQYSASLVPGSDNASVIPWTDIALPSGASSYSTPWPVNFGSLVSGATNYISVRAWSIAGTTSTVVDAFYVLTDTAGPSVAVSSPSSPFISSLNTISGTAAAAGFAALRGVAVSVQELTGNLYWNGGGFASASQVFLAASTSAAGAGQTAWSLSPGIGWTTGTSYRIVALSSDTLGQYSIPYATATFTFDATAPAVGVASPQTGSVVTFPPSVITGTASTPPPNAGLSAVNLMLRRNTDGLWWNFLGQAWTSMQASSQAVGGAAWTYALSPVLQANLASGASYTIMVDAVDNSSPPNHSGFATTGNSTFTYSDTTPPAAVANLTASTGTQPGQVLLAWTAPGDNGNSGIILAGAYSVAYSTFAAFAPSTAAAQVYFATASVVPGTGQATLVSSLLTGTTYFFYLFTRDTAGNWSGASNEASSLPSPQPFAQIGGHVVNASTQGITAVEVDAYDGNGNLTSTTFSLADGSGTYTLSGLTPGTYKVQAAWTANGITSSVWIDGVPMGTGSVDFALSVTYSLSALTGTLAALTSGAGASSAMSVSPAGRAFSSPAAPPAFTAAGASGGAGAPAGLFTAAALGSRAMTAACVKTGARAAAACQWPSAYGTANVQLFINGKQAAQVGVQPTGRWLIPNLLPGKYGVRAFNGVDYTDIQEVELGEGEVKDVGFVFNPLPENSVYAFPNPARSRATFRFMSGLSPLEAQIQIFDLAGKLVKEIAGSEMTSPSLGLYHADWNLTNGDGAAAASGVYLYMVKVRGGSDKQTAKVVKKLAIIR